MKQKHILILILAIALFGLTSCADTQHNIQPCLVGEPAGFFEGIWHGIVLPFSWFGNLLDKNIALYAVNNTGGWYNFGFAIGTGAFTSCIRAFFVRS